MEVTIERSMVQDLDAVTDMAMELWSGHDREEMYQTVYQAAQESGSVLFTARVDGVWAGFAQCGLRHDYVEGTRSSPVGYLEGILVKEEFARRGIATRLLGACEDWAREMGCQEFASDCELDNGESLAFHLAAGFREANRVICFTKAL